MGLQHVECYLSGEETHAEVLAFSPGLSSMQRVSTYSVKYLQPGCARRGWEHRMKCERCFIGVKERHVELGAWSNTFKFLTFLNCFASKPQPGIEKGRGSVAAEPLQRRGSNGPANGLPMTDCDNLLTKQS
jgi:hypothetical protein